jgi:integrase
MTTSAPVSGTRRSARRPVGVLTFHALRHTCAALLIDRGVNPLEIMRRLGHADIKVTLNTYGHLYAKLGRTADRCARINLP